MLLGPSLNTFSTDLDIAALEIGIGLQHLRGVYILYETNHKRIDQALDCEL